MLLVSSGVRRTKRETIVFKRLHRKCVTLPLAVWFAALTIVRRAYTYTTDTRLNYRVYICDVTTACLGKVSNGFDCS